MKFYSCHLGFIYILKSTEGFNKFYKQIYLWSSTPVLWDSFIFWCIVAQKMYPTPDLLDFMKVYILKSTDRF